MRFLIVKMSSLGDILHAYPCVDYLREKFPEAQIDWVVEEPFKELVEGIATPIIVSTREWRTGRGWSKLKAFRRSLATYDVLFDLQGNIKSALIIAMVKAKTKVGFAKPAEWPNRLFTNERHQPPKGLNIRDDYLYLLQSHFDDFYKPQPKRIEGERTNQTLVCPGTRWPNKQLSEETLKELLQEIEEPLLIWGTDQERELCERIVPSHGAIAPKMSLTKLRQLMAKSKEVIAVDSLALHLAGTTGTPCTGLFGPSSARKYAPQGARIVQGECPYGITFEKRCPKLRTCKTGACMKALSAGALDRHSLH